MADKAKEDAKNKEKTETESEAQPEPEASGSGSISVETLRRYIAEKLGFLDSDEKPEKVKVLDDLSLDGVIEYIQKKNCKNIITMAGAGISTSAGIPDFRSPGCGLYHNLEKYNLPDPQAIFETSFFRENPKPFFVLAKELYPGSFKPTPCHYFIKLLNDKGVLLRHYTQNIDTLERLAGLPEQKLVEAHGTFYRGHCLECDKEYSLEWIKERIFNDEIPICLKCPGVVKPDIVFFGDSLPEKFHKSLLIDFPKCDLLLILGSSLVVQPFASLIDRAPITTPRLLINREKAGERTGIMAMLGMGEGMNFGGKDNTRDVFWGGDCDDGCQLLADKLGWGEELKAMIEKEHAILEKEEAKTKKETTPEEKKTIPEEKETIPKEKEKSSEKKDSAEDN